MAISDQLTLLATTKAAIKTSIEAKGQTVGSIPFSQYAAKIDAISGGGSTTWTGSIDEVGLRAIGWDDNDIAWYKTRICWDAVEDDARKVPQWEIDDYASGALTIDTIGNYTYRTDYGYTANKMVYLPHFDYSGVTNFSSKFKNYLRLKAIPLIDTSAGTNFSYMFSMDYITGTNIRFESLELPLLDTSNGLNFSYMFNWCISIKTIPLFNTSKGTNFSYMFNNCKNITSIPLINTSAGTNFSYMFRSCTALTTIPLLVTSAGTDFSYMFYSCTSLTTIPLIDTAAGTNFNYMFYQCTALTTIPQLNLTSATSASTFAYSNTALTSCEIKNIGVTISDFSSATNLSVDSMVYMMTNAKTVSGQTMTFGSTNLAKLTSAQKAIGTSRGWTIN